MNARVRLPLELSGLLRSELEKAIYEAALSREDDFIARRYIIEKVPQREIEVEIARLEYMESSYSNYAKLADLYTIQNQMHKDTVYDGESSYAGAPVIETCGDSDFLQAVSGKDSQEVWHVVDNLMDTLRVVNHKAYERVMRQIKEI